MLLRESKVYKNDLLKALNARDFTFLDNTNVLVTGANGLICSAIVDLLTTYNQCAHGKINIFVATRNIEKSKNRFGEGGGVHFLEYDALKPITFKEQFNYIICGAANASPELYVNNPVETAMTNLLGISSLLDYAKRNKCDKFIYISSSEIYGKCSGLSDIKETDKGIIDHTAVRSSYSVSKIAGENLCIAYHKEFEIPAVIARPGHIFGPTASEKDKRVSSAFAYLAAKNENLVLRSDGLQLRSYMYCIDAALAFVCLLANGVNGEAYNICIDKGTTIRQMAESYAKAAKVSVQYDIKNDQMDNPMDKSFLSYEKINGIGFNYLFDVDEGFEHTVKILRELMET